MIITTKEFLHGDISHEINKPSVMMSYSIYIYIDLLYIKYRRKLCLSLCLVMSLHQYQKWRVHQKDTFKKRVEGQVSVIGIDLPLDLFI